VKPPRYNPDWYRVKYSVAALHANAAAGLRAMAAQSASDEAARAKQRAEAETQLARRFAHELALASAETLQLLDQGLWRGARAWWRRARRLSATERIGLQGFLRNTMQPPVLVLLAGLQPSPRSEDRHSAPLETNDDLLAALRSGDPPDPRALTDYVEQSEPHDPRTDYNLACLYLSWGEVDLAADRLLRGLQGTPENQRARLIDRAFQDPTLNLWQSDRGQELKSELTDMRNALRAKVRAPAA